MLIIAVIVFAIFIIIAHIFAPQGYSWTAQTVSSLADPEHPRAWILRAGMLVYGSLLIASISEISILSILIAVYGLGLISTGIFTVKKHSFIHMFSIYIAGGAIAAAMIRLTIEGDLASILCLAAMLSAELLFNIKTFRRWRGLTQRIVHLSTLIWLICL